MSHIAKIELEINDLDCLIKACQALGFHFMENQQTYAWYGEWEGGSLLPEGITVDDLGKCHHAIHVPEAVYEIGIVKAKTGNKYNLLWDSWYEGGLERRVGRNAGKLKQAYTVQRIRKEARMKAYRITETKQKNGVRLSLTLPR